MKEEPVMQENFLDDEIKALIPDEGQKLIAIEGANICREIVNLRVTNKDTYQKACALGISNNKILKGIESFRLAIVKPLKDQVKKIDQIFKRIAAPFDQNDSLIRAALTKYTDSVKMSEKKYSEGGIKTVYNGSDRATVMKVKKFEIVDEALVPREWLCVDREKLGRAVRAGLVKEIPGIRIFEESTMSFANGQ